MKKRIALLVVLINLITLISCSVESKTPDIESLEWTLIQYKVTEWGELSEFLGLEEGDSVKVLNDAEQVFKLNFKDGKIYLTNKQNSSSLQGSYLKKSREWNGSLHVEYEIDLHGNNTLTSVIECILVDWNTEMTGFDGNLYGDYCIDLQFANGTFLSFFAS